MTFEEALTYHRCNYQGFMEFMIDGEEDNIFNKAFAMSLSCMEKEIPLKVNGANGEFSKEDWHGYRCSRYKCPSCNKIIKQGITYCYNCGQKLMFPTISFTPYIEGQKQDVIINWSTGENDCE